MKYLRRRRSRKSKPDRAGHLAIRFARVGLRRPLCSGTARDIVKRALALGITLFDTAEVYGLGKSERILGEALGDQRAEVAVASKIMPIAPFPVVIRQRERASARRLQLDRIPLYQIHQPNPVSRIR